MKTPFSFGFGSSRLYSPKSVPSTPITTSAFSQPDVLKRKMEEKKLTHAETVTATISPVRLESHPGKMVMYFCPMKAIEVIEKVAAGDGNSLPSDVKVEGLVVPRHYEPGLYTLKNVVLTSNGTMQVIATKKTVFEKYVAESVR
ncbi:MAG TPA: hypothetical protein VFD56_11230 [Chitinophagaceae bacterium]|nr:hypothetical protein [Chitinophagaceae bacterium]